LLKQRDIVFTNNQNIIIKKIVYLGDEGGISCYINSDENNNNIVSITHLRLSNNHPFASDVKNIKIVELKKISN
jgi:hypothetical protein